jgi:hypothetical protein
MLARAQIMQRQRRFHTPRASAARLPPTLKGASVVARARHFSRSRGEAAEAWPG